MKSGCQINEVASDLYKIRTTCWLCGCHNIIFQQDEYLIIVKLCMECTICTCKLKTDMLIIGTY